MKKEYQESLFNKFTEKDAYREFMRNPFIENGIVYATDSKSVIYCKEKDCLFDVEFDKELQKPNVTAILPNETVCYEIELSQEMFDVHKSLNEKSYNGYDTICVYCDGHKEVTWNFEHHTMEYECPECNGTGCQDIVLNLTNEPLKGRQLVLFKNRYFSMFIFYRLIAAKEVYKENVYYLGEKGAMILFKVGTCKICLASLILEKHDRNDDVLIIKTIQS